MQGRLNILFNKNPQKIFLVRGCSSGTLLAALASSKIPSFNGGVGFLLVGDVLQLVADNVGSKAHGGKTAKDNHRVGLPVFRCEEPAARWRPCFSFNSSVTTHFL